MAVVALGRFDISPKERNNYDQESYLPWCGDCAGDPSE